MPPCPYLLSSPPLDLICPWVCMCHRRSNVAFSVEHVCASLSIYSFQATITKLSLLLCHHEDEAQGDSAFKFSVYFSWEATNKCVAKDVLARYQRIHRHGWWRSAIVMIPIMKNVFSAQYRRRENKGDMCLFATLAFPLDSGASFRAIIFLPTHYRSVFFFLGFYSRLPCFNIYYFNLACTHKESKNALH